jgi:hypothetical protein
MVYSNLYSLIVRRSPGEGRKRTNNFQHLGRGDGDYYPDTEPTNVVEAQPLLLHLINLLVKSFAQPTVLVRFEASMESRIK